MEPRSGIIFCKNRLDRPDPTDPTSQSSFEGSNLRISLPDLQLTSPIMSVPTFYVCPQILCLSPPIMSVPTCYVCPHLLCLSPPVMSVPPIMSVPTFMSVPTH